MRRRNYRYLCTFTVGNKSEKLSEKEVLTKKCRYLKNLHKYRNKVFVLCCFSPVDTRPRVEREEAVSLPCCGSKQREHEE